MTSLLLMTILSLNIDVLYAIHITDRRPRCYIFQKYDHHAQYRPMNFYMKGHPGPSDHILLASYHHRPYKKSAYHEAHFCPMPIQFLLVSIVSHD